MTFFDAAAGRYRIEGWGEARVDAYQVMLGGYQAIRWSALSRALAERDEVPTLLTRAMRESPHEAFFWECCPWRGADPRFSFVLAPTGAFGRLSADPSAFAEHFDGSMVATFDSLGGDARLIAPRPMGRPDVGLHLARFVREGPPEQVAALWIAVGNEIAAWRRAGRGPLWLSTSGLGVPWVHVRLDSRPKYYTHAPYR